MLTAAYGPGGAALGGLLVGGINATIAQTGNGVGLGDVDWGQVALSSAVGGITGYASAGISQWAGTHVSGVLLNNLNISAQSAIGGGISGIISGALTGYGAGFIGGLALSGGDWKAAHQAGISGLKTGAAIGLGVGSITGAVQAHRAGNNIFTGEKIELHHSDPKFLGGGR